MSMTSRCLPLVALAAFAAHPVPTLAMAAPQVPQSGAAPLFDQSLAKAKTWVDAEMASPIVVPFPADAGGGYTHERHKDNYRFIHDAGVMYRRTGNPAYADRVRRMLLEYAALYPKLGPHPKATGQVAGRLFWQLLNDSVWLVNSIQGYADVRDAIPATDRDLIERGLFRPMAQFLSTGSPKVFDSLHNHVTWALAGVGMTGHVLGEKDLVTKALYGLDGSGKSGFYKQLDELFSPDGYYTEGPYYQRYALLPFVLFAHSVQANDPQRKIFAYRDGVLVKAVHAEIQQSYAGRFFPINDSLKEKGLDTPEMLDAVAIAYGVEKDPSLLSIAVGQGGVALSDDGLAVAAAIGRGEAKPFGFASIALRDGGKGDRGALVVMRSKPGSVDQALVFKSTAQGMGHGHFDKLGWLFYDAGREVVSDYGAARFHNIEAKAGGRYLRENNSWAKQTVAHNTLVVDEASHYGFKLDLAEAKPPKVLTFETRDGIQLSAATADDAYEKVGFTRVMAMIDRKEIGRPIVLDLVKAKGTTAHRFDLPVHYRGQFIGSNLPFSGGTKALAPLGVANGYQHLWNRGEAPVKAGSGQLSWFNVDRFYTFTFASPNVDQVILTELGANDPDYNLRNERAFMLRGDGDKDFQVVSVLEPHGAYSHAEEYARDTAPTVQAAKLTQAEGLDLVQIRTTRGSELAIGISYNPDPNTEHVIKTAAGTFGWKGFFGVASPIGPANAEKRP